jgi:hypothetical protein
MRNSKKYFNSHALWPCGIHDPDDWPRLRFSRFLAVRAGNQCERLPPLEQNTLVPTLGTGTYARLPDRVSVVVPVAPLAHQLGFQDLGLYSHRPEKFFEVQWLTGPESQATSPSSSRHLIKANVASGVHPSSSGWKCWPGRTTSRGCWDSSGTQHSLSDVNARDSGTSARARVSSRRCSWFSHDPLARQQPKDRFVSEGAVGPVRVSSDPLMDEPGAVGRAKHGGVLGVSFDL